MPSKEIELIDEIRRLKVEADNDLDLMSNSARSIIESIEVFHGKIPITNFNIIRDSIDIDKYDFIITCVDGRIWHQIFYFDGALKVDINPLTGIWYVDTEITPIQEIRRILMNFIDFYKVRTIEYERF